MSAPPETDRTYAYFRAVGVGDIKIIDGLLKLNASESWSIGEEYQRNDRTLLRRSSCWQLDSGYNDTVNLETHVEVLLRKLSPKASVLQKLSAEYKLQIVCVSFVYQSFSFELPFELQKQATDLGIGFWFDSYSFGDLHEEVTELREQLSNL